MKGDEQSLSVALRSEMMRTPDAGAVLFTIKLSQMTKFYEKVIGLSVGKVENDHVVLESGTFSLTVHQIPPHHAKNLRTTAPPPVREDGPIKLSFLVSSIAKARDDAATLGGFVYGADREWKYGSTVVCDGWDPDGNVFQLRQVSPT